MLGDEYDSDKTCLSSDTPAASTLVGCLCKINISGCLVVTDRYKEACAKSVLFLTIRCLLSSQVDANRVLRTSMTEVFCREAFERAAVGKEHNWHALRANKIS